jgi:2,4-dienoyl-CoA reductase-like NADH-dependent reductase (Old Yellow Enzyme family)
MAEALAPSHIPNEGHLKAYEEWSEGDWGMVMTGETLESDLYACRVELLRTKSLTGNVMVSDTYMGGMKDVAISSNALTQASKAVQESWKNWADTSQRHGAPTIVQLCHPGRQSPAGAGNRGFFAKTIAPSAVKMDFGPRLIDRLAVSLVFGTPRAMTVEEISGNGGVVDQFVAAAKQSFDAGFKGVELHGA